MNDQLPVLVESHGEVITITLNRPESFNAIDYPTALALRSAIDSAAAMPGGRVVVLRGAGKSFCGGGDVLAMHANRADLPGFIDQMIDAFHASVMALSRLPMPVIASVHGRLLVVVFRWPWRVTLSSRCAGPALWSRIRTWAHPLTGA